MRRPVLGDAQQELYCRCNAERRTSRVANNLFETYVLLWYRSPPLIAAPSLPMRAHSASSSPPPLLLLLNIPFQSAALFFPLHHRPAPMHSCHWILREVTQVKRRVLDGWHRLMCSRTLVCWAVHLMCAGYNNVNQPTLVMSNTI